MIVYYVLYLHRAVVEIVVVVEEFIDVVVIKKIVEFIMCINLICLLFLVN